MPDRGTVCGLLAALSVKASAPVSGPNTVGLKVTFTVHLALTATVAPQVLEKMAKLPLVEMLLMVSGAVPVLVNVTVFVTLVVLMTTLPKPSETGERVTTGALAFTCCVNTDDVLPRKFVSPL